jgi:hypothetical protein
MNRTRDAPISPPQGEATSASRPASNQRVGPARFTNCGPERPSAYQGTLSRKKRCTRRLMMCSRGLTGGRRPKSPPTTTELASGHDRQLHEAEVNRNFSQCFPEVDQILSLQWSTQSILMVSSPQRDAFQNSRGKTFNSAAQVISYAQGAVLDTDLPSQF